MMKFLTKYSRWRILVALIGLLLLYSLAFNYMSYKSSTLLFRISNLRNFTNNLNESNCISENCTMTVCVVPEHNTEFIETSETSSELPLSSIISNSSIRPTCTHPKDGGPLEPNTTLVTLNLIEAELESALTAGGGFEPTNCLPKEHVAIVVPFRDRDEHLCIFLRNIHPFLQRQRIAYRIFIIEQTEGLPFNRGALMNIGFLEALKIFAWNCFIFHDVDLLPLDSRNIYNCPLQPRHMSVAVDKFRFRLLYRGLIGGVTAMTRAHVQTANGFSNLYFGWGGEDDDMYKSLIFLRHSMSRFKTDGINSIKYEIRDFKEFPTFTWYLADIKTRQ